MSDSDGASVKFTADIKSLLTGMSDAQNAVKDATEGMTGNLGDMIEAFEKLGPAALALGAIGIAAEGLKEGISFMQEATEKTNSLAKAFEGLQTITGASLKELGEYNVTAQMVGGSVEDLNGWIMSGTRAMKANEEVFIANGIAADHASLMQLSFGERLAKSVKVIEETTDSGTKLILMQELLGRSGVAAYPQIKRFVETLGEGKETFKQVGAAIDEEVIARMVKMEKEAGKLSATWQKTMADMDTGTHYWANGLSWALGIWNQFLEGGARNTDPTMLGDGSHNDAPAAAPKTGKNGKTAEDIAAAKAWQDQQDAEQRARYARQEADAKADEDRKTQEARRGRDERARDIKEFDALLKSQQREKEELAKLSASEEIAAAKDAISEKKKDLDLEVAMGRITAKEEMDQRISFIWQEYAVERNALQAELMDMNISMVQRTEANNKLLDLERRTQNQVTDIKRQAAATQQANDMAMMQGMEANWATGIQKMLAGQMTLAQGMKGAALGIADYWEKSLIEMGMKELNENAISLARYGVMAATKKEQDAAVAATKVSSTVSSNTATNSADALSSMVKIADAAAVAGANVFAAYAALGPEVALPLAAAAETTTMGFMSGLSLSSAAGGWDRVPSDQVAMIHKNEMVLPAPIAEAARQTFANGGAGTQIHIHAMDGADVARVLTRHQDTLFGVMKQGQRNGRLR